MSSKHLSAVVQESLSAAQVQITSRGLRQFCNISPDALVVVNQAGTIMTANGQIEDLFGYAPQELLGQPLEVLLPERFRRVHRAHRERYVRAPQTRPMGTGLLLLARHKDGTEVPVDIVLRPVLLDKQPHVIAVARNLRRTAMDPRGTGHQQQPAVSDRGVLR